MLGAQQSPTLAFTQICPNYLGVKHVFLLALSFSLLVACHHDREAEGPVQRAGKHVDNAAEKTGAALQKAAEKTDQAAHTAVQATGNAFEKAGQKLKGSPSATPASSSTPASDK